MKLPDRKRQLSIGYALAAYNRGDFTLTNPPKSTQQVQQTDKAAGKDTGPERESPQPHGSGVYPPTVLQDAATTHTGGTRLLHDENTGKQASA